MKAFVSSIQDICVFMCFLSVEAMSSAVSALRWASARGHRRVVAALVERLGPEARDEQGGRMVSSVSSRVCRVSNLYFDHLIK